MDSAATPASAADLPDPLPDLPGLDFPCSLGITDARGDLLVRGDARRVHPLASVSKPVTALGALIAVQRCLIDLDEPAGPEGSTVRHLLAHAAGYAFDADTLLSAPGARRIYSNTGFEVLGRHLEEATGTDLTTWIEDEVIQPLGLRDLEADGSPAAGFRSSVADLLVLGREMLAPTLVDSELWDEATHVQFPRLSGVLPGYGRQEHNDWGLGFEIRDHKSPHWSGATSSPESFGHFGQSGSFLLVDPVRGLALAFLGDEPFGPAHQRAWPGMIDAVLARADAGVLAGEPGP